VGNGAPELQWTHDLAAQVVATPVVVGSSLLVSTEDGHIAVISAADGTVQHTIKTADRRIWGTPASAGSTIYVTDLDHGATVAFDVTSGDQIWEQKGTGASAADLELDGNLLLVAAFDRALHAIDVDTAGSEVWTFEGDGWFMGRPLIQGNTVYAATMQGTVYALDRATGTQKWSYTAADKAEFRSAVVVVDGSVLAASRDGRLLSIDASSGTLNWSKQAVESGKVNANIYTDGSQVYLLTSSYDLVTVDLATQAARPVTMAANR
jgi:eukaryotic-like serine/threonine-protein kinase